MQQKSINLRLYPTQDQEILINKTFGCNRFIYNKMLDEKNEVYNRLKNNKPEIKNYKYKTVKQYKEKYPFLREVSSWSLIQTTIDLCNAYICFFKEQNDHPVFKTRKNPKQSYRECQSIYFSKTKNKKIDKIRFEDNKIKLLKLGWVKTKGYNNQEFSRINNVTIKKHNDKYYVVLNVNFNPIQKEKNDAKIGLDLGLTHFIINSNNNKINNPKFFKESEKKIKQENRRLSRKKIGSSNYKKQKKRLATVHEKITNCRNNFLHNLSSKIVNENQVIICEDLSVKSMMKNKYLSKSISDSSWGEFIRQLKYKSGWYDRNFIQIDRFFPSSKKCSKCGHIKDNLNLSDRIYKCDNCGLIICRDYNAALNILEEGLRILNILMSSQEFTPVEKQGYFVETGTLFT